MLDRFPVTCELYLTRQGSAEARRLFPQALGDATRTGRAGHLRLRLVVCIAYLRVKCFVEIKVWSTLCHTLHSVLVTSDSRNERRCRSRAT